MSTILLDTAEGLADYEQHDPATGKPKKDSFDLMFKIGLDVAKAGISAIAGAVIVGAFLWGATAIAAAAAATLAIPVIVLVVGTMAAAVFVGFLIDLADKKTGA